MAMYSSATDLKSRPVLTLFTPAEPSSRAVRRLRSMVRASDLFRVPVLSRMRWPWKTKSNVHTRLPLYLNKLMDPHATALTHGIETDISRG